MKEKKQLTKRELEDLKKKRHTLMVRVIGYAVIAVMVLTLCASLFTK